MLLLVSGEGPSDIGLDVPGEQGWVFRPGPMTHVIDRLFEHRYDYSALLCEMIEFISEQALVEAKKKHSGRKFRAPGKRKEQETNFYYENAQRLAILSAERQTQEDGTVIPILFRDSDTVSIREWRAKWQSMLNGFESGGSSLGVPMIPQPKSEAWLLCACRDPQYEHCAQLESAPGNDDAPAPLKPMLDAARNGRSSAQELVEAIENGDIDPLRITMPSFDAFRARLNHVLDQLNGHP